MRTSHKIPISMLSTSVSRFGKKSPIVRHSSEERICSFGFQYANRFGQCQSTLGPDCRPSHCEGAQDNATEEKVGLGTFDNQGGRRPNLGSRLAAHA